MNSIKINDRQMGEFNFDTVLKLTPSQGTGHGAGEVGGVSNRVGEAEGGKKLPIEQQQRNWHFYCYFITDQFNVPHL